MGLHGSKSFIRILEMLHQNKKNLHNMKEMKMKNFFKSK